MKDAHAERLTQREGASNVSNVSQTSHDGAAREAGPTTSSSPVPQADPMIS